MDTSPISDIDANDPRPLVVHVIYRLQVGGLENGVVNLVNNLPRDRFRHAIVCMTDFTDMRNRIQHPDVAVIAMHKRHGQDLANLWRLFRLFRRLRPAVVHTRNIGCLEAQIPAWLARVPLRIHGEHGWDVNDPDGSNMTYRKLRRLHAPLIHRFIPLSGHLDDYLQNKVGIRSHKICRIYNGVDIVRFRPGSSDLTPPEWQQGKEQLVYGTVGRMHGVKDQLNLARAFIRLRQLRPQLIHRLKLLMIGDGPLKAECETLLAEHDALADAWLPGARDDIPTMLRAMKVFVLPSQAEGISNTLLEAMASGLPVIATEVGGNPELVEQEHTGLLVPSENPEAMAQAMCRYADDQGLISRHGEAGLQRVRSRFSLQAMLDNYAAVYRLTPKEL